MSLDETPCGTTVPHPGVTAHSAGGRSFAVNPSTSSPALQDKNRLDFCVCSGHRRERRLTRAFAFRRCFPARQRQPVGGPPMPGVARRRPDVLSSDHRSPSRNPHSGSPPAKGRPEGLGQGIHPGLARVGRADACGRGTPRSGHRSAPALGSGAAQERGRCAGPPTSGTPDRAVGARRGWLAQVGFCYSDYASSMTS